ncbi:YgfZ/GcvT domain-containing protein [Cognatilysobacter segetis]|uniref:CAF17-like 4Fe-4S cluster assembly/insertion protein YgfZ n=1 Tax=Cognatilysobacter segetis TaxID=2492394 RepID=UPI001EE491D3|nr:folate-binding protein [Lysobacter segetis]
MNDVAALADGHWQWNGWLDPKGRVQALFALLRVDAETLWLVTTADDAFDTALSRFIFRSKVRIGALPLQTSGALRTPAAARGATFARDGDSVELDLSADGGARTLRLAPGSAQPSPAGEAAWWRLDIVHGWPAVPGARLADWTPQQLSLQRLHAFSVKKGCYPGQEIVARTHFLGRAKRGLARVRAAGAKAGDVVHDAGGRDVGAIVACVGDEALAVLPLEPADASYRLGDATIDRLTFEDGLSR